ncbi:hypothetical protein EV363DRAFT_1190578 [Boletus edulis]|nr:hypothetical protein EV363DRAFT_1190578 [Boletus edulis]
MFLREKRSARRSRYLYAGGGHLTDENAPLSQIFFPLRENIRNIWLDDREYTASCWHSSYYRRSDSVSPLRVENEVRTSAGSKRPANALNDLCKGIR